MLLVNGEIKKNFGKDYKITKPVRFKLKPEHGGKKFQEEYGRPRGANFSFPPVYTLNRDSGHSEELRFTDQRLSLGDGPAAGYKYSTDSIDFMNGDIITKDPALYYWLKHHPSCEQSPDKEHRKIFFEYNPVAESQKNNDYRQQLRQSLNYIYDAQTEQSELRELLGYFGEVVAKDEDMSVIQDKLAGYAEVAPDKFIEKMGSESLKTRTLVVEAEQAGVIKYHSRGNRWSWNDGDHKGNLITPVPAGQDEYDWFVKWLENKDTSGVLAQISELVDEVEGTEA